MGNSFNRVTEVRKENALIHVITNQVVMNDSANGLLALGASPFMSSAVEEMAEVVAIADAVVLNIGTLTSSQLEAMEAAGTLANQLNKPVVLDPVGVGATTYRKQAVMALLEKVHPTVIRGNAGEIAALSGTQWQAKGVDAGSGTGDVAQMARKVALQYQTLVAVSGITDILTDGTTTYKIHNGTSAFTKMTGAGCLLSCICGAYLAKQTEHQLEHLLAGCTMYAVAGEIVAKAIQLPAVGTFRTKLLDQLSIITSEIVTEQANIERVEK
jgi:hydroxyethylthiazole kinase